MQDTKQSSRFHVNHLLADDSHDLSSLIFLKMKNDNPSFMSASAVIGALRVKQVVKEKGKPFIYFLAADL